MIMEVARYFDGSGKNPTQFSPFDLKQSQGFPFPAGDDPFT